MLTIIDKGPYKEKDCDCYEGANRGKSIAYWRRSHDAVWITISAFESSVCRRY